MDKSNKIIGIDISKDVFDVYSLKTGHKTYDNNLKGFRAFKKTLTIENKCLMEATGYYHHLLAMFLFENKINVSVENPLKIKRFLQMQLTRIQTDKADAKGIYNYGISQEIKLWTPPNKQAQQLLSLLDTYQKQGTQIKNKIHGEQTLGCPSKTALRSLKRSLKNLAKEIKTIEQELESIVKQEDADSLARLQTIPGIGQKTAVMLLIATNYFENFETAAQLCSFSGLTPIIKNSGSSVKSKPRISKMGNPKLRNLLFMCSFNACKYNKACRAIYERIVAKGKSKKLALIAVCNKLLKQAFAIVKSELCYDENYTSKKKAIS